jgi:hypothetical protein
MGRNIKLNNTIITLLEQGIQNGLTIKLSCQHAGCSEASYFAWMNRGKNETDTVFAELYRRIKKAESNNALMNLALIQKAAKEGTWHAAAWLLERRHNYTVRQDPIIEITMDNSQISVAQLYNELKNTDNQLKELISRPVIDLDEE